VERRGSEYVSKWAGKGGVSEAVLGAWSGLAAIKRRVPGELPSAVGELGWRWSSGAESR